MKKLLVALSIIVSSVAFSQESGNGFFSKIGFGVRASGLYNTTSLGHLKDVKELEQHGFNVGIAAKVNVTDKFSVTPELYYAHTGINEINLPVLLGYSFLGNKLDVIAGPSLIYTLEKDSFEKMPNFNKKAEGLDFFYQGVESTFDVGYVAGLQYHFGKFMLTARYQGAFEGREAIYSFRTEDFTVSGEAKEKIKTSFASFGVGYNF
ncbi:MAG TPA: outer membrane beta-barrel protein [Moheibacter sp.]|nr:outer membrane beta-barrel protein [Moheibacter sp.]